MPIQVNEQLRGAWMIVLCWKRRVFYVLSPLCHLRQFELKSTKLHQIRLFAFAKAFQSNLYFPSIGFILVHFPSLA